MNAVVQATNNLMRLGRRITHVYTNRCLGAESAYLSTGLRAAGDLCEFPNGRSFDPWSPWLTYQVDLLQRSILFWETLRQRGNNFLAHEMAGKPPLLVYDYEIIVDGRQLARPVNYALVRIVPPKGVEVDKKKRPFIIIDPRAGHGPGIGGFKQDSQVGVALRAGHPVYFVVFFPRPVPGQTVVDVCEAESQFVEAVVERHPASPKPALVGNCQGGWATMLLAASRPDITGPVVINGAPMSYWSGNWQGGEGENPMRYLGGLMGGSWAAMFASDLGNGLVDGANFVANFERLNPANTFWNKYYHLFANVDTEPPRFLEFERWWGGYFLMNEEELRWIVDNLFVGNRLARGEAHAAPHRIFDLKSIRSPIVIFSSAGDNITPPQQALNWIADAYSSTEEIKANGQVIVALLHPDVGHLGIFVSGRVAKKEHAQIVEVLKYIESLRPGLYVMEIEEHKNRDGTVKTDVTIEQRRLEDLRRINKLERIDEKPFEIVSAASLRGEKLYSLCARPFIQPLVNEWTAEFGRWLHPLRVQRWALSNVNPCMWPLAAWASLVKAGRLSVPPKNPYRRIEHAASEMITAGLNLYRDLRDATMESLFFQIYGPASVFELVGEPQAERVDEEVNPRDLHVVRDALATIGTGGYPEALALIGALVGREAGPIPLKRLELVERLIENDEVLSKLSAEEIRRIKAAQAVIAELEPERGLESLPTLLAAPADRKRALIVLDEAVAAVELTAAQQAMLKRIEAVLSVKRRKPRVIKRKRVHAK